jgi:hypothetical protein
LGLPTPRLPSGLLMVYGNRPFLWRTPGIPIFLFWFQSQYLLTCMHFVVPDYFLFSTLLLHILTLKFSLKSCFPRSSEWIPFILKIIPTRARRNRIYASICIWALSTTFRDV